MSGGKAQSVKETRREEKVGHDWPINQSLNCYLSESLAQMRWTFH